MCPRLCTGVSAAKKARGRPKGSKNEKNKTRPINAHVLALGDDASRGISVMNDGAIGGRHRLVVCIVIVHVIVPIVIYSYHYLAPPQPQLPLLQQFMCVASLVCFPPCMPSSPPCCATSGVMSFRNHHCHKNVRCHSAQTT